jgi:hypothetical protein
MARLKEHEADGPPIRTLIEAIVVECTNPEQLLELYYWSREPKLLPTVRALASLPNETRAALEAFIADNDPNMITAKVESGGQIWLASRRRHASSRHQDTTRTVRAAPASAPAPLGRRQVHDQNRAGR